MAGAEYGHPAGVLLHRWKCYMSGDIHARPSRTGMGVASVLFFEKATQILFTEVHLGAPLVVLQFRFWIMDVSTFRGTFLSGYGI